MRKLLWVVIGAAFIISLSVISGLHHEGGLSHSYAIEHSSIGENRGDPVTR